MSQTYWYLKQCDLFERLPEDQLQQLESASQVRKFPRNSPIYLPAENADGMLLLASGRVRISSFTNEGKQTILAFIEPGEVFGELVLFEDGQREECAEAVEPSTVVCVPADSMKRLLSANPDLTLGVTRMIGLRRRRIERRLKYLLFHSNRQRLVHLLLELAEQYGMQTSVGTELGIRLSHQDLASIIGSTRETVTVVLGELHSERLVALGRRRVVILDLERLTDSIGSQEAQALRWTDDGAKPCVARPTTSRR